MIRYALESLVGLVSEVISYSHSCYPSLGRQCGPSDFTTFVPRQSHNRSGSQHLKDIQNSKGEDKPDHKFKTQSSSLKQRFVVVMHVVCIFQIIIKKSHQLNFHIIKSQKIHPIKQKIYYYY